MSTTAGLARTANARAARTRTKHDRWAAELAGVGRTVVEAGPLVLEASIVDDRNGNPTDVLLAAFCSCCRRNVREWRTDGSEQIDVPLPAVLHAVTGHTCEERS